MSKYYILMKDTKGGWAIYPTLEYGFIFMDPTPFITVLETYMDYLSIRNIRKFGGTFSKQDIDKFKKKIITGGMSYREALRMYNEMIATQELDLKKVKKRCRKEHTVEIKIISQQTALAFVSSIPVCNNRPLFKGRKTKLNSIEFRRRQKNYKKNDIFIYK